MSVIVRQNGFHLFHRQFVIVGDFFRHFAKFFALNERLRGNALRANGRPDREVFRGLALNRGNRARILSRSYLYLAAILSRPFAWPPHEDQVARFGKDHRSGRRYKKKNDRATIFHTESLESRIPSWPVLSEQILNRQHGFGMARSTSKSYQSPSGVDRVLAVAPRILFQSWLAGETKKPRQRFPSWSAS
jgi:hypothetical protein